MGLRTLALVGDRIGGGGLEGTCPLETVTREGEELLAVILKPDRRAAGATTYPDLNGLVGCGGLETGGPPY